jgi:tetratricopeptide (TPR) repeat protein
MLLGNICSPGNVHRVAGRYLLILCLYGAGMSGLKAGNAVSDSLVVVLHEHPVRDKSRVRILYALSWELKTNDPGRAMEYAQEALHIADSTKLLFYKAILLDEIGVIHQIRMNNREALFCHLQALRLYQQIGHTSQEGSCLNNIGLIYFELKKFDLAKKYLLEAKHKGDSFPGESWLIGCYSNLGIMSWELGQPAESISWFSKCIEEAEKTGNSTPVYAYMNLAEIYTSLGQLGKARDLCRKALVAAGDDTYLRAGCTQILAQLAAQEGKFAEAERYFTQARGLVEKTGIKLEMKQIYRNMADMYEKKGDFKRAYSYSKIYNGMKDTANTQEVTRQISEMQIKYETEKKDEEIARLSHIRQIADQKAEKERIVRDFFITAFVLICIISIVLLRNSYLNKKINTILNEANRNLQISNDLLNEKTEQIEKQNRHIEHINIELNSHNRQLMDENAFAKYEVLKSKTDPHFLFNSLASLSAIVKDNEMASEFLERFTDLYRMILETGSQEMIPLKEELEVVNNYLYLEKVRFGENIVITTELSDERMNDMLPPFALQIAVENTIKHNIITDRKKLSIHIYTANNCIMVRNNLQKKHSGVVSTHTGQKNIRERYVHLSRQQPEFIETETEYMVILPLIPERKEEPVI